MTVLGSTVFLPSEALSGRKDEVRRVVETDYDDLSFYGTHEFDWGEKSKSGPAFQRGRALSNDGQRGLLPLLILRATVRRHQTSRENAPPIRRRTRMIHRKWDEELTLTVTT